MSKTDPTKSTRGSSAKATAKGGEVVPVTAFADQQRPSEKLVAFIKRHPGVAVAGAVAAGVAVSALLPRKSTRRILGRAAHLAEAAGAATLTLGRGASEKMHDVGNGVGKQVSSMGADAGKAGHKAAHQFEKYGLAALAAAGALGRATAARAAKLGDAASDKAHQTADAAAAGSHKFAALAGDLRDRLRH